MLQELGELWEDLQRKHQENGAVLQEIDKVHGGRSGGMGTEACPTCGCLLRIRPARLVSVAPRAAALAAASLAGLLLLVAQLPAEMWQHGLASSCLEWLRARPRGSMLSPLSPQALRLVGELDKAERWLQAVAESLSEPATMRSPVELRRDLEETDQLEKQLLLCGLRLQALREEVVGEPPAEPEGARKMQRKVEMVEDK